MLATVNPDLVILDVRLPDMSGLEVLAQIRKREPRLPVIIMTAQGTMSTAIEATGLGAFDYHLKPFDPEEMLRIVSRALEAGRLMQQPVELGPPENDGAGDAIVGASPPMQELFKAIGRVAATDATILLRGERGTGKELVARAIYQFSKRNRLPMHVVNCVAIPETLLEGELFGYERGAFTGAQARRIGKFEQARGGTIFLDEIGDLSMEMQAKLLRVLQERTIERLGGNETLSIDVRILAATNRDLESAIAAGKFREDLYDRLNVVTIRLPPLRERPGDVPKLVTYFTSRFARQLGFEPPIFSDEALELLLNYQWPGNVRELEHCIHRILIFSAGLPIQADDVRRSLGDGGSQVPVEDLSRSITTLIGRFLSTYGGDHAHDDLMSLVEKEILSQALARAHGNRSRAARLLGITRPTLHNKLQKLGLSATAPEEEVSREQP
jgi:DNA-binding NtrC family response regulator